MSGVVIELSGLVGSGVVVLVRSWDGSLGCRTRVWITPTNGIARCGNRSPPISSWYLIR